MHSKTTYSLGACGAFRENLIHEGYCLDGARSHRADFFTVIIEGVESDRKVDRVGAHRQAPSDDKDTFVGNDITAVLGAFDAARDLPEAKPRVILFDTLMGKGVPFLERREKNHFIRVDPPEWQQAIQILDQSQVQGVFA